MATKSTVRKMIPVWTLFPRLLAFYSVVALAFGVLALFVVAFMFRTEQMALMIAGGFCGLIFARLVRWMSRHVPSVEEFLCSFPRIA